MHKMFCAVRSCRTTSENGEIFSFPEDDSLKQQWLKACNLQSSEISPKHGLCHIHFKADQIQVDPKSGCSQLSSHSLPSLFLEVDPDLDLFYDNKDSHYNRLKTELDKEANLLDKTTSLLTDNALLQKKASAYLKKVTDLEKDKLRRALEIAEKETVVDQLLRINKVKPLQLNKVNTTISFSKNGLFLKDSNFTCSHKYSKESESNDRIKKVSGLLETIGAIKFATNMLD